jgi:hypothetical protein
MSACPDVPSQSHVEACFQRLLEAERLPNVSMDGGAMRERIDSHGQRFRIDLNDQSSSRALVIRPRNSIMSRHFQEASSWSSGKGGFDGQNALIASCNTTELSLPIE